MEKKIEKSKYEINENGELILKLIATTPAKIDRVMLTP